MLNQIRVNDDGPAPRAPSIFPNRQSLERSKTVAAADTATCHELRVRLLGEPVVSYRTAQLQKAMSSASLLLLGYVVLHRETQLRERVAAALWPDVLDCEARANLRRHLHLLVRALPEAREPWLLIDKKRIAWNPAAPLWCDVEAFDRLSTDECTRAEAVDIYGGDLFLSEDAEWLLDLRNRLRERQSAALDALAVQYLHAGDATRAAACYRRILSFDPFREDALRALLVLRYACGDRAGAVYEYRAFVNRLTSELGLDPMSETIACYERVVRGQPADLCVATLA